MCGFVAVLSALQDQKVIDLGHYAKDTTEHRDLVISLVKDFFRQLDRKTASDVETFTKTFGGNFSTFTLHGFLQHDHGCGPEGSDRTIGIGMTPAAVIKFLHYVKRATGRLASPASGTHGPCIMGLGTADENAAEKGLKHWIYYKSDNEVYTWGKKRTLESVRKKQGLNDIIHRIYL
jgi:hypothetical protein